MIDSKGQIDGDDEGLRTWMARQSAMGRGEVTTTADLTASEAFEREHPELRRESALWFALGHMGASPKHDDDVQLDDAALMERVIVAHRTRRVHRFRPSRSGLGLALAAVLCGLALVPLLDLWRYGLDASAHSPFTRALLAPFMAEATRPVHQADQRPRGMKPGAPLTRGKNSPVQHTEAGSVQGLVHVTAEGPSQRGDGTTEPASVLHQGDEVEPTPEAERVGVKSRSSRRKITVQPEQLLTTAQDAIAAGDVERAHSTYTRLVQRFPTSAPARVALISLARLEMERGRLRSAVRHARRHLKSKSPLLREEARLIVIRAERERGRRTAEIAAIEAFVEEFPNSAHRSPLDRRLARLQSERGH